MDMQTAEQLGIPAALEQAGIPIEQGEPGETQNQEMAEDQAAQMAGGQQMAPPGMEQMAPPPEEMARFGRKPKKMQRPNY